MIWVRTKWNFDYEQKDPWRDKTPRNLSARDECKREAIVHSNEKYLVTPRYTGFIPWGMGMLVSTPMRELFSEQPVAIQCRLTQGVSRYLEIFPWWCDDMKAI